MCHVRSATTSLWLARNFFVCRRLTVIVPTAAMNFRSASPPARQVERRINAPVKQHHDAENIQSLGLCVISTAGRNLRSLTFVRDDNPLFEHCDAVSRWDGD